MATAERVKEKLESIINSANLITKKNDTTVTDAFLRLCEGYGASGAVNAAVKMTGIDTSAGSISAGDFVQLIPSWGSGTFSPEKSKTVAIVPLTPGKAVVLFAWDYSYANTLALDAILVSAEGLSTTASTPFDVGRVFKPALGDYGLAAVALNERKVLVVWKDATTRHGFARVLTVSGDTISAGDTSTFYTGEIGNRLSVTALTDSKALVVYQYNTSNGYARPLTVNGTTITPSLAINIDTSFKNPQVVRMTDSTALVVYETYDLTAGRMRVLQCPSTSVTAGSVHTFRTTATSDLALTALDTQRALLVYRDAATTGYLTATIFRVSGTSVIMENAPSLTFTSYGGTKPVVARVDAYTALVVANILTASSGYERQILLLRIGDSSISKAAVLKIDSITADQNDFYAIAATSEGSALVAIKTSASDSKYGWLGFNVAGTTIVRQTTNGTVVVPLTTTKYPIGVAKTSGAPGDILYVYRSGEPADTE